MGKVITKDVRPKQNYQDKVNSFLSLVEATDSEEAAKIFRAAFPDHALSRPVEKRPTRSTKRPRR